MFFEAAVSELVSAAYLSPHHHHGSSCVSDVCENNWDGSTGHCVAMVLVIVIIKKPPPLIFKISAPGQGTITIIITIVVARYTQRSSCSFSQNVEVSCLKPLSSRGHFSEQLSCLKNS